MSAPRSATGSPPPVPRRWRASSIGTSLRPYAESREVSEIHPLIAAPASILIQRHEAAYPRSLAEKSYTDIRTFERLERGGHFTAWEAPRVDFPENRLIVCTKQSNATGWQAGPQGADGCTAFPVGGGRLFG